MHDSQKSEMSSSWNKNTILSKIRRWGLKFVLQLSSEPCPLPKWCNVLYNSYAVTPGTRDRFAMTALWKLVREFCTVHSVCMLLGFKSRLLLHKLKMKYSTAVSTEQRIILYLGYAGSDPFKKSFGHFSINNLSWDDESKGLILMFNATLTIITFYLVWWTFQSYYC